MKSLKILGSLLLVIVFLMPRYTIAQNGEATDEQLRQRIINLGLSPLTPGQPADPDLVALGEALFFDKILSGNRDIACATCHHPLLHTIDEVSLGLGTGANGLGAARFHEQTGTLIPRNAPDLYNRGLPGWTTMFWDGRIERDGEGRLLSPAEDDLPSGLGSVLAAQAMFPVTSAAEMRGLANEPGPLVQHNELIHYREDDFGAIWEGLMHRIEAIPAYAVLCDAAYPDVPMESLGFQHMANALAAYEAEAFTFIDSPWNRYLEGDVQSISLEAKQGALLFYGGAGCVMCHTGDLLTGQNYYNMAVPQIGPGKGEQAPYDYGRLLVTGQASDAFAFRTPSLLNVGLTGPYMHNGAYTTLEAAIRHMTDPVTGLGTYDPAQLSPTLISTVTNDAATQQAIRATAMNYRVELSEQEIQQIVAFLESLTDPAAQDLTHLVPDEVPSGLPVDD